MERVASSVRGVLFCIDRSFAFMSNRVRTHIRCALSRLVSFSLDRRD